MGTTAEINPSNSQLFSLVRKNTDVMWNGGAPEGRRAANGWPNSEIIMFPIIGSAVAPGQSDKLLIDGMLYQMSKHGVARGLDWEVTKCNGSEVVMVQNYIEGSGVLDGKGGVSSFPRSYKLEKTYSIVDAGVLSFEVDVKNMSDKVLPFAIGWHPAFMVPDGSFASKINTIDTNHKAMPIREFCLEEVRSAEGNVLLFENADAVFYSNPKFSLLLAHNFPWGAQLWDKGEGYVAIEPISAKSLTRSKQCGPMDLLLRDDFIQLRSGENMSFKAEISIIEH